MFNHLHCHTAGGSLLDGLITVKELVSAAKKDGASACAITEHDNMYSAYKFYTECMKQEIKPIIGIETRLCDDIKQKGIPESFEAELKKLKGEDKSRRHKEILESLHINKRHHLVLLAENNVGLKNLFKLSSLAFTDGFYKYPRIDYNLLEQHNEGILASSACAGGVVAKTYLQNGEAAADIECEKLKAIFKDRLYFEVMKHGTATDQFIDIMRKMADRHGVPLVATNDVHYLNKEDSNAQKLLVAISRNSGSNKGKEKTTFANMMNDPFYTYPDELYYKSAEEMSLAFFHIPQALKSTLEIAERCNVKMGNENKYPLFALPEGITPVKALTDMCVKAVKEGKVPRTTKYLDRLKYELGVIKKTGYAEYFLIIADCLRFAKEKNIYNMGRGSGSASLVAYLIGITWIDPIEHDLDFDRMLNTERVSPPDFDIDFADDEQHLVVEYLKDKYGSDSVVNIISFGTLSARAALTDSGTVLNMPFSDLKEITDTCPAKPAGIKINKRVGDIPSALDISPELVKHKENHPDLFMYAEKVEGCYRHTTVHACGILIAPGKVTDYMPISKRPGDDEVVTTQWDKNDIDNYGMLKADFLRTKTLSVLRNTINDVKAKTGEYIDLQKFKYTDQGTWKMIRNGFTVGVFQFESTMMRGLLTSIQPDDIQELAAINAIGRPGPLQSGFHKTYAARKFGHEEVECFHPDLDQVLKKTYGTFVFQEQLLSVSRIIAGFSKGEADDLRRAVGKKKYEAIATIGEKFINRSVQNGYTKELAERLYDSIKFFGQYAFVKAHALSYSALGFITAYFKLYYPLEYMKNLINGYPNEWDQMRIYIDECKSIGLDVLSPDIQKSEMLFSIEDKAIRYGLSMVKGMTKDILQQVINLRPFKSFEDFMIRCVNILDKSTMEGLVESGALDSFGYSRWSMQKFYNEISDKAKKALKKEIKDEDQMFLLEMENPIVEIVNKTKIDNAPVSFSDSIGKELNRLGTVLSNDFFKGLKDESLTRICNLENNCKVSAVGAITDLKLKKTRANDDMANFQISDGTGTMKVVVFPKAFVKLVEPLLNGKVVKINGKFDTDQIIAEELYFFA